MARRYKSFSVGLDVSVRERERRQKLQCGDDGYSVKVCVLTVQSYDSPEGSPQITQNQDQSVLGNPEPPRVCIH